MSKYNGVEKNKQAEQDECCIEECSRIQVVAEYAGAVNRLAFEVKDLMDSRMKRVLGSSPEDTCVEPRSEPDCDMEVIRTALESIYDCLSQIRHNANRL